ncbi:MAG: Uncharacterized protein XE10_1098 [Methanoculleus marisnigri]|jgi:Uncharacterized protein conserved in archaea|uniref:UPF0305 protein XD82_0278 n=1 Tax=Methanoculleus marisnigri TaxID=2198 RepID=A0A117LRJ2_9EURY|nr:MAG: Uncharacterized protein XD82_0278 [Methanoculleus marisnigri]KUL01258.1 MAG: Uncharacterized protein XE10_1098 [Methanoculleus marisnigri]
MLIRRTDGTMRLVTILACIRQLIGREGRDPPGAGPGEVCSLLINTFAGDSGEEGEHEEPGSAEAIRTACRRMQGAETKGDLLRIIAGEVAAFDLHDLEAMNARFERKVSHLPEGYRDRLLESVREEIFSAHHRLLLLSRNGGGQRMDEPPDPALDAYCSMVAEACTAKAREKDPRDLYLKYLLSAFTIFVQEEPAHPVGTPFPGGQIVDEWEGAYLCPARDMADDVPYALCPYCPAAQSTEPTYPEMRARRREQRQRESLANYWTNYKG